jgi:hypothetical protein
MQLYNLFFIQVISDFDLKKNKMKIKKILQIGILISVVMLTFAHSYTASAKPKTPEPYTVDDLIYKFETSNKDGKIMDNTTTDYVAALPETEDIEITIGKLVRYGLILANILAFISFVVAGLMMILSEGESEMLDKSKSIFTMTIVAMITCAVSLAVVVGITQFDFFNI